MFQSSVGSQNGVVRLDDSGRHLRGGVDGELELGLLAIVDGQTFHQQGSETRAGTTTEGMEDQEALQSSALVRELADAVQHQVDDLLANGVVTTSVVVGSVFFASDELLRVEQSAVRAGADLINNGRLKINEDGARDMFAGTWKNSASLNTTAIGLC